MELPIANGFPLQSAATSGAGQVAELKALARSLVAYITGTGVVSTGAVQLETAPSKDYAGTWAAIGSPVTVVSGTTIAVTSVAPYGYVRARISTAVTGGGSVTVQLFAR